jgi:hypothetical protein
MVYQVPFPLIRPGGHLLPRGEGGETALNEGSVRIGVLQLVL